MGAPPREAALDMLALALWVVGVTLALWALPLLADSGRVAMDWRLPRQETP